MAVRFTRVSASVLVVLICVVACDAARRQTPRSAVPYGVDRPSPASSLSPERRGIGVLLDVSAAQSIARTIDRRRSLAITDKVILAEFSFAEVMLTLARQSTAPGVTPIVLFRQWWATQNRSTCPQPDVLFGFPYDCRTEAAQLALADDPFTDTPPGSGYVPIGLFNRLDLAPGDGSDCGEYRIIFARKQDPRNHRGRLLINFEAKLLNPQPAKGLAGCKPIAEFWANLTSVDDPNVRARLLRQFYFVGLPGFSPVVHVDNYGARGCRPPCATGQIRTNERLREPWMLREFRTLRITGSPGFRIVPARIAQSPFAGLFCCRSVTVTDALLTAFRDEVAKSVEKLALPDLMDFRHHIAANFDTGQGLPHPDRESDIYRRFTISQGDDGPRLALHLVIQTELDAIRSRFRPETIVGRIQALSCAGCHHLNGPHIGAPNIGVPGGPQWPSSLDFTHVTELHTEAGPDGPRYKVSDAVLMFLERREAVLKTVLGP